MGFQHGKGSSNLGEHLFKWEPNVRKKIRFLDDEPTSADVHNIPKAHKGKTLIRDFRTTLCRILDEGEDDCQSKFGEGNSPFWKGGQTMCGDPAEDISPAKDPLWDLLDKKDRYYLDNDGEVDEDSERDHFPVRRVHVIRVYDYSTNSVKVMRFGKQIFDKLKETFEVRESITSMDWTVIKNDKGRGQFGISYDAIPMDSSKFKADIDTKSLKLSDFLSVIQQKDLGPFCEGELSFDKKQVERKALSEKDEPKGKKTTKPKKLEPNLESRLDECGMSVEELRTFLSKHAKPKMGKDFMRVAKYTPDVVRIVNKALDEAGY